MKKIYFMGIGGTAMGNAAILCKQEGYQVSGSDTAVYPPMSDRLAEETIAYREGYSAEELSTENPDLVIIGNALSRGNPEIEWLLSSRAIPFTSLAQFLSEEILSHRHAMVVTGTHGKTTTSTMLAYLLNQERQDKAVGYLIGGVPKDLPGGSRWGSQDAAFVIEGDEYDTAFFDKRSKFIHYAPNTLIINNIEFDHGDIFRDLDDILRTFSHLLRIIPQDGLVLINGDDPNIQRLFPVSWITPLRVGTNEDCEIEIRNFQEQAKGSSYNLFFKGKHWGTIQSRMHGIFNARNAAMAIAAAAHYLHPHDPSKFSPSSINNFSGVKRRQERLLETDTFSVIEDFGHHPTAISHTITSLRAQYPDHQIAVCFEPRSNTAVTNRLEEDFRKALGLADQIYLPPIHRIERIPVDQRLSIPKIVESLTNENKIAIAFPDFTALQTHLEKQFPTQEKTVLCFFSNGSFGGILKQLCFL